MLLKLLVGALAGVGVLTVYVYNFIFIHGSPNRGTANDAWIRRVAFGPDANITKTTRTWGFFKASFREFRRYYRTLLSPEPQATVGKIAPGGDVYSLDGQLTSLEHFMDTIPPDMPLILNIGSYSSPSFANSVERLMREVMVPYCSNVSGEVSECEHEKVRENEGVEERVSSTAKKNVTHCSDDTSEDDLVLVDSECSSEGVDDSRMSKTCTLSDTCVSARAKFLTVYIDEAHAMDEWYLPDAVDSVKGKAQIPVHRKLHDRLSAAAQLVQDKGLRGDVVVDSMDNSVADRYFAWPERLYIILDGRVVYKGGMGPNDYTIGEVVQWLRDRYGEWLVEDE